MGVQSSITWKTRKIWGELPTKSIWAKSQDALLTNTWSFQDLQILAVTHLQIWWLGIDVKKCQLSPFWSNISYMEHPCPLILLSTVWFKNNPVISNGNTDGPSGVKVKGWKALFMPVVNLQSMERLKIYFLVETTTRQRVKTRGTPRNASFWSQRKNSQAVNFVHLAIPFFKRPKDKFTSVQLVGDILKPLLPTRPQNGGHYIINPKKRHLLKGKFLKIHHTFVVFHFPPKWVIQGSLKINRPSCTANGAREVSTSKRGEVTKDFKVPSKA